jgi:hypothetical protein
LEAERVQGVQDVPRGLGHCAGRIEILHAHQPFAPVRTRLQVAPDSRDE